MSCGDTAPHDKCGNNSVLSHYLLFAIYAILAQNLFCRDIRAFVWKKIVLVEKKGQIWGMDGAPPPFLCFKESGHKNSMQNEGEHQLPSDVWTSFLVLCIFFFTNKIGFPTHLSHICFSANVLLCSCQCCFFSADLYWLPFSLLIVSLLLL